MGLTFTSDARPPSNTQLLPNRFLRPAFGELYGFDADADSGGVTPSIDGALTTELSEPLTTELGDFLAFDENVAYWTPALLTTENWYDAADTATITDTAGVVSQWDDKSGNANHLTAVGSGIFTDRRTRNSSNVMDIEEGSYFTKTAYQLPADCSIFMMAGIDSINVNTDALLAIRGGSSNNFQFDSGDVVGDQDQFFARFNATNIGTTNTFSPTVDQKGPSIYELIFDLNGDGDLEVFIDGTTFGTTAYTTQCGANSELLLFTNRSLNQYPDGCAAEVIIVPSVLSTTDRQKMEGYLAHKWGLTAQLDVSHPYKTSRPLA